MQRWRKLGQVFVASGQSPWLASHGIVPIARPMGGTRVRIYFSPRDVQGRSNVSWLDLDLRDPTRILRLSEQPVLAPGALGCFDDRGAMCCWIVDHEGEERLYYQGWNLGVTVPFHVAVGLAARPAGDPDRSFVRISEGPILDRCLAEPRFIADPAVLLRDGVWRMWYQSGRPWTATDGAALPCYDIRTAVSEDGLHWNPTGQQAMGFGHPGEVAIARFCPLPCPDGGYRAWYSYRGNEWSYRIGTAISRDGVTWTRQDGQAGITLDPESWEHVSISYPFVFDGAGARWMLYNSGRYGSAGFGIAVLEQD